MRPDKGSLVFEIPGWDLIERAKTAGFEDAYFSYISSAQFGILGKNINGVFVFSAMKSAFPEQRPPMASNDCGPSKSPFQTVAALVGLPRSGTTVFAAVVGAHSNVKAVYEPWNSRKKNMPPTNMSVTQVAQQFGLDCKREKRLLFVKETAAELAYLDAIDSLLADAEKSLRSRLIWLYRDPLHVFLSEVEGRRTWWDEPNLGVSVETFDKWAERSIKALNKIVDMCGRHMTMCIRYETFVQAPPEALQLVMNFLGLSFETTQLDYYKLLDKSEIRGDNNVARDPKAISNEYATRREREARCLVHSLERSRYFKKIDGLRKAANEIFLTSYPTSKSSEEFMRNASEILHG